MSFFTGGWQFIVMTEAVQVASLDLDSAIGAHKAWIDGLDHVIIGIVSNTLNRESVGDNESGTYLAN